MNYSDDLENWMSNLSSSIRKDVPLINLAIPGSHDSCSYGINRKSRIAPDAEEAIKKVFPFFPCVVRRWSKTQKYSLSDQLNNGIRYFDLRVATRAADMNFYFVHALFCEEISEPLTELLNWLKRHPEEVVILDFQHFYAFCEEQHHKLITMIFDLFKDKIFKRAVHESNLADLTLSNAYANNKQLVIIYRSNVCDSNGFFRSYDFPTPWPNATKIENLKEYLDKRLQCRAPHQGFVTQCILTPDVNFILPRFYSTLRKKCATKVDSRLTDWIKQQTPGRFKEGEKPKSNVFLGDFIDIRNNNFSKIVVDLNMKLEPSTIITRDDRISDIKDV